MAQDTSPATDMFKIYQDMFLNQQKFMPSGDLANRLISAGRHVMDAQLAYSQALMSANAELISAWSQQPRAEDNQRPSVAAKA